MIVRFDTESSRVAPAAASFSTGRALPAKQPAAEKLAGKEGAYQDRERYGVPPNAGEEAQGDDEGHRQMNRKKPLPGEPLHAGSPVPERKVYDEDNA
jgi:hypothetical protein